MIVHARHLPRSQGRTAPPRTHAHITTHIYEHLHAPRRSRMRSNAPLPARARACGARTCGARLCGARACETRACDTRYWYLPEAAGLDSSPPAPPVSCRPLSCPPCHAPLPRACGPLDVPGVPLLLSCLSLLCVAFRVAFELLAASPAHCFFSPFAAPESAASCLQRQTPLGRRQRLARHTHLFTFCAPAPAPAPELAVGEEERRLLPITTLSRPPRAPGACAPCASGRARLLLPHHPHTARVRIPACPCPQTRACAHTPRRQAHAHTPPEWNTDTVGFAGALHA